MHSHLVYSPGRFAVASGRNLTHKLFRRVTKLMVTKDCEYVQNSTSSSFAFLSYPFHMGTSLPLEKPVTKAFRLHKGVESPGLYPAQPLILCPCEQPRN